MEKRKGIRGVDPSGPIPFPQGNIYRRDKIFSGHMRFRSSGAAGKSVIRPIHARGCRGADWWDIPD
ncbi:uncharacterized protein An08g00200 [Aspergillus niger]|uniref:Contig An08c0010, genomic contig n=2 Tax=Aspergillus niger TaxID=5061 RepID=A2QPU2_ASPNC|nr:uncharacterized protein An08g00200 [Aspergillus niger]CAK39777.1 unnamed protein product [Aspergillus niger]